MLRIAILGEPHLRVLHLLRIGLLVAHERIASLHQIIRSELELWRHALRRHQIGRLIISLSVFMLAVMMVSLVLVVFLPLLLFLDPQSLFMISKSLLYLLSLLLKHSFCLLVYPLCFLLFGFLDLFVEVFDILFLVDCISSLGSDVVLSARKIHYIRYCSSDLVLKFLLEGGGGRETLSSRETYWNVIIGGLVSLNWLLLTTEIRVLFHFEFVLSLI